MEARLSGHGVSRTEYHFVWITKYRRRILNPGVVACLSKLFPKVIRSMPGCEVIEQNIQPEHIHMLMVIPPKYAVSEVAGEMKQFTSGKLREKFAYLGKVYWKELLVRSPGYFVSPVELDEEKITEYVKWQEHQDSGQAKLEL
jgi:putative transposase